MVAFVPFTTSPSCKIRPFCFGACVHFFNFFFFPPPPPARSPDSLSHVYLTGGLAPLGDNPDEVYQKLCARVLQQNARYYARYPEDVKRARDIVAYLKAHPVVLPKGGKLTPQRFQLLGLSTLGMGGGFERLHYLLLEAFEEPFVLPQ